MNGEVHTLAKAISGGRIGVNLVKTAAIYMVGGLALGILMGISQDFTLSSVHSHVLLLGWVTTALTGLVYIVLPACGEGWLARVHYWGSNLGLPLMMTGLLLLSYGKAIGEKIVGPASIVLLLALSAFMVNVFVNGQRQK